MNAHPSAVPAEQAALGACLLDAKAAEAVLSSLRECDCYQDRHAKILLAIRKVVSRGERADLITVGKTLGNDLQAIGGTAYLTALVDVYCPIPSNHRAYVSQVKASAIRRRVIVACQNVVTSLQNQDVSLEETVAHLQEDVESYLGDENGHHAILPTRIDAALKEWLASWDSGSQPLTPTGYNNLDTLLGGGFEDGEFILLGARAGVGKTALALDIAVKTAAAGKGVLVISREMRLRKLLNRMLSQVGHVPAISLRRGSLAPAEYGRMTSAYGKLATYPIWLDDKADTLSKVESMVDGWAFTPRLSLVVVDYLQLLRSPKDIKDRRLQVEHISAGLKALAMRHGCPIMALSSLSRVEKGQQNRPPVISDLRESGELDHDADIVILLHRKFGAQDTECIVAKARDGGVGIVNLTFEPEYVEFTEVDKQYANG